MNLIKTYNEIRRFASEYESPYLSFEEQVVIAAKVAKALKNPNNNGSNIKITARQAALLLYWYGEEM